MDSKYKRVIAFLSANDCLTYSLHKKIKAAAKAQDARSRRKATDAEKPDAGWRTTESGKHYQINEKGDVIKGPKAMVGNNVNKEKQEKRSKSKK